MKKNTVKKVSKHLLTILVTSFLFKSVALGSPIIGQDYLALQNKNFDSARAGQYLSPNTSIGILDNTFGNNTVKITEFLIKVNPAYVRVHILNTVCVRNKNCGDNELTYKLTKDSLNSKLEKKDGTFLASYKKRVGMWKVIAEQLPQSTFLISPALEHDLSLKSFRTLADTTLEIWPNVQLVNSPDGGIKIENYRNSWIERHGSNPQKDADIISLDGVDASDIDMDKFIRATQNTKLTFIWSNSYNCRVQGVWEDPRKRRNCPTGQQFELLSNIGSSKGEAVLNGLTCRKIAPLNPLGYGNLLLKEQETHVLYFPLQSLDIKNKT